VQDRHAGAFGRGGDDQICNGNPMLALFGELMLYPDRAGEDFGCNRSLWQTGALFKDLFVIDKSRRTEQDLKVHNAAGRNISLL